MHRGGNRARNHSSSRPHDSATSHKKKRNKTYVSLRPRFRHTCEQLHVQLSAIYRIAGHRQTNYLIICDRSEKLERPTVKPLSGMPHSSGKKKIMSAAKKGDLCIVAEESRNATVFGGKFAKSFPSFHKVRIAKFPMIGTEMTTGISRGMRTLKSSRFSFLPCIKLPSSEGTFSTKSSLSTQIRMVKIIEARVFGNKMS